MSADSPSQANAVDVANKCLATDEAMALLKIHQFQNDIDAHNDDEQERLTAAFEAAFSLALAELDAAFGRGLVAEGEGDPGLLPLGGVFLAATWGVAGKRLYLAAAHEDRETPYLLAVGVA